MQAERILDEFRASPESFGYDVIGLKAVEMYYKYYFFERRSEMMYRVNRDSLVGREDDLFNLLSLNTLSAASNKRNQNQVSTIPFKQAFQTAARSFYAIESFTRGVVVPYSNEGKEIIKDLCGAFNLEKQYRLVKKAQRYSVNLLPHELKLMAEKSAVHEVREGSGILYMVSQNYDSRFGWSYEGIDDMKLLIS